MAKRNDAAILQSQYRNVLWMALNTHNARQRELYAAQARQIERRLKAVGMEGRAMKDERKNPHQAQDLGGHEDIKGSPPKGSGGKHGK